jgi:predicted transcriptional regulator
MELFVMKSAKAKVLAYLSKDSEYNTLTVTKMQSVFGIANPSATINELRNEGHAIYHNTRVNANGDKVSFYRLGQPTKRIVAAGIAALRAQGERAFA